MVFSWLLSFCLFFFSIEFKLLILERTMYLFLFIGGVILLHDGPWYGLSAVFIFFLYNFLDKTSIRNKFDTFKEDLSVSFIILEGHYVVEVFLFFVLKMQSLWFLVIFGFIQNFLQVDVHGAIGGYSITLLEIYFIFKTHVLLNLMITFVMDYLLTKISHTRLVTCLGVNLV